MKMMMQKNQDLQLGKLIPRARVGPVAKWHEDAWIFGQELQNPSENTSCSIACRENNTDNIIGNLLVRQTLVILHEGPEQIVIALLHFSPYGYNIGEHFRQLFTSLHCLVEKRARQVNRHRVVTFFDLVIALLEILPSILPRLQGAKGNGLDVRDHGFDGLGHESAQNELSELGVIIPLMEKYRLFAEHSLFASRECGLEEMGF
ncbi:tetR family transcriptional regulator [Striga asiatica]|uniref:TetR family transcriptional regulator n=1 Tax=Striga asiatica TaxID=4170 RepID=A0A5A7PBV9_STRAF|nr:tetR family transcriptional regulator [Striga asiatica]